MTCTTLVHVRYVANGMMGTVTAKIEGAQGGPEPLRREESASTKRISTGVGALDAMLGGGVRMMATKAAFHGRSANGRGVFAKIVHQSPPVWLALNE